MASPTPAQTPRLHLLSSHQAQQRHLSMGTSPFLHSLVTAAQVPVGGSEPAKYTPSVPSEVYLLRLCYQVCMDLGQTGIPQCISTQPATAAAVKKCVLQGLKVCTLEVHRNERIAYLDLRNTGLACLGLAVARRTVLA